MVGLIATTLLAGARMPAGATSNMKRKIPRDAADRIAVAGPERDVRNLVPFLRMEKCFFLTSPFIEHEAKNSEGRSRSYCSRWAGAGCQKFGSFPADGEVFFLDIPFYRTTAHSPRHARRERALSRIGSANRRSLKEREGRPRHLHDVSR